MLGTVSQLKIYWKSIQRGLDKLVARCLKNIGGNPSGPDAREFLSFLMILYKRSGVKIISDKVSVVSAGCMFDITPLSCTPTLPKYSFRRLALLRLSNA